MPIKRKCIFLLASICFVAIVQPSQAMNVTSECKAVDHLASIKRPSTLIVGIAKDRAKRICIFYVSMPPPNSLSGTLGKWFEYKLSPSNFNNGTASETIKAMASIAAEGQRSAIDEIVDKNSKFISDCLVRLLKGLPGSQKSPDGRMQCFVPKEANFIEFHVSANSNFTLSIYLPRSA